MKRIRLILPGILLGLLTGCQTFFTTPKADPQSIVRIYPSATEPCAAAAQILLLPPMGAARPDVRRTFQQQLFSSAQRHFKAPIQLAAADSAYADYLSESNLMRPDGSLNLPEIASIGRLMKTSHVVCPSIREFRPYHPQKISLSITVVQVETGKITAELSGIFDANDPIVQNCFRDYRNDNKTKDSSPNDLRIDLRSPALFQTFVSDTCCTQMANQLPL